MPDTSLYTIGLDFGTLSGRALLVRVLDGTEIGYVSCEYPHGVMERELPSKKTLGEHWALQHPNDYLHVIQTCIPELLRRYGVSAEQVVGLGVDFTSCTVLPVTADAVPLCTMSRYEDEPHAYVKLWKHHAAQYCADIINQKAEQSGQPWLGRYGGKISSEFLLPKLLQIAMEAPEIFSLLQIAMEAPEIFSAADLFLEAGDWIVWKLTGRLSRSACMAGYKAAWSRQDGFPSKEYLQSLHEGFAEKTLSLLEGDILPPGAKAGNITPEFSALTGLSTDTVVSTCMIDAHSAVPAASITSEDNMLMIMGTSTCHISLSKTYREVEGICGIVQDGIIEGYYGYEAGQACVGDHFEWLSRNLIPVETAKAAEEKGVEVLDLLASRAQKQRPGAHGLLALDWWNGNRTVLTDSRLTGLMVGMNLTTQIEDIYRALIEATAYGTRKIIENYEQNGIVVRQLYASGGMSKSDFIMQIYADVTGKEIKIAASSNGPALGAAIFAAVAAGKERGGWETIQQAAAHMGKVKQESYLPCLRNKAVYDRLYAHYLRLHDYFSRGENPVMKELLDLREQ